MQSIPSPSSKTRVAIFAGGRSTEHEVSLISAYNIAGAVDTYKYEVFIVGIDKQGVWRQYSPDDFVVNPTNITEISLSPNPISGRLGVTQSSNVFYDLDNNKEAFAVDVIFPAILGNYSEDGTVQGMIRMMDVPFTTADTLGSAAGMDKDVAYRLLRDSGINVAKFTTLRKHERSPTLQELQGLLSADIIFVKPANAGSSVGVSRVTNETELSDALKLAFLYDVKVIAQAGMVGREVEIGVIGNIGNQKVSIIGEIVQAKSEDFYSYENKYVNDSSTLIAPADIDEVTTKSIEQIAIKTCEALECEGFARVDFFLTEDGTVYVNEINTMPGFTAISMFPRLWQESGLTYTEIITTLLETAIERWEYRIKPIITDASDIIVSAKDI
jgi:D-alanine-D-alanine ligase